MTETSTATVLFTDVVGSVDLRHRHGEKDAHAILKELEGIVRAGIAQHAGQEIKTSGDSFMVGFESARKAVECAIAIQRGLDAYNRARPRLAVRVRIGIHTGEVIRSGHDLLGSSVDAAARVELRLVHECGVRRDRGLSCRGKDMNRFDLKGKVALVTGGNGGIGMGIARGLLECGAAVVIAGRNEDKNRTALAELGKIGPPVSSLALDVTDEKQCRAAISEVVKRHGRLDILVNNAGIGAPGGPAQQPEDLPLASWHKVIDTNLTSVFVLSQLAYPEMKKAGGGKIINIASMASFMGGARWTAYGPAKAGIVQLTRNCAASWGKDNIQVNAIWPGLIDTAMTKVMQSNKDFMARVHPRIAAGRVGTPGDFAGVAAFLASSASDYVTGADIRVDGGLMWGA